MAQSKFQELFSKTDDLLRNCALTAEHDYEKIERLKEDLQRLARSLYPDKNVKAYLYGSRLTGLASKDSDVDIYLDIGDKFGRCISEATKKHRKQEKKVIKFENAMLNRKDQFKVNDAVTECQVPILKFEHKVTGLKCDLCFRSGMSTKNSELVKFYLDWDPRVKYIVTGVKVFMKEYGLAGQNKFTSYAQTWLALFFLMQPGIEVIPTLLCLRILATQKGPPVTQTMVEYWDCTIPKVEYSWQKRWIKKKSCKLSSKELLTKFFTFYSSLPPLEDEFVLTTYNGMRTKKKNVFPRKLSRPRRPIRMFNREYIANEEKGQYSVMQKKYKDDITDRFYLQDPFHQLKNLTKMSDAKASEKQMHAFVKYCKIMTLYTC